jgi:hypothetical protein
VIEEPKASYPGMVLEPHIPDLVTFPESRAAGRFYGYGDGPLSRAPRGPERGAPLATSEFVSQTINPTTEPGGRR